MTTPYTIEPMRVVEDVAEPRFINRLQDGVVRHEGLLGEDETREVHDGLFVTDALVAQGVGRWQATAGSQTGYAHLFIPVGLKIYSWSMTVLESANNAITASLYRIKLDDPATITLVGGVTSPGTSSGQLVLGATPVHTVLTGYAYAIRFTSGHSGDQYRGARYVVRRP